MPSGKIRRPASCRSTTCSSAARNTGSPRRDELDAFVAEQEEADRRRARRRRPTSRAADRHGQPTATAEQPTATPRRTAAHRRAARSPHDQHACSADLAKMGFDIQSLIPQERTGTRRAALHAPPRRERDRPRRPPRPARRHPRRRRKGPARSPASKASAK